MIPPSPGSADPFDAEALLDLFPHFIAVRDREGRLVRVNRTVELSLGRPREELVGRRHTDLVPPELADWYDRDDAEVLAGGVPLTREEVFEYPEGPRSFRVNLIPVPGPGGEPVGVVTLTEEITGQRDAEAAARAGEARIGLQERLLEQTQQLARVGGWELDVATGRVYWTDGVYRILEVDPLEFAPTLEGALEFFPPPQRAELRDAIDRAAAEGRPFDLELELVTAAGNHRWMRAIGRAELEAGRVVRVFGAVQDITDRKAADAALRESEAMLQESRTMEALGRMASGVAHDFNNIITVIVGSAATVMSGMHPGDPRRAEVEEIRRMGERASALTRQLLAFGRRQLLNPRVLDLNQVVTASTGMLERLAGPTVQVHMELDPGLSPVQVDPTQVERVVANLVVNARDAMPQGGEVVVRTRNVSRVDGDWVELTVADTGMGMTADVRARLFEPFFSTKGEGRGTGLGLPTVYGIVHQSGGRMEVESEPGQGTLMRVLLPRAEGGAGIPGGVSPATTPDRGPRAADLDAPRIVLVEDEDAVRSMVERMLVREGYRVVSFPDGESALVGVGTLSRIDLLLTDVVMPGMNGRELFDRLEEERPGLKVLYMSGYTDDLVLRAGVRSDGVPFLPKPFTSAVLAERVRAAMGG